MGGPRKRRSATRRRYVELSEADRRRLVVVVEVENGRRISREHVFEGSSFRVGSDPDVEVVLDDPEIAGCHIRLHWDGRTWWASDTGKGTVVRGMRIDHVEVPHDDALVELGGSRLWLRHRGAGDGSGLRDFGDLVGASSTMQNLIALLRQVARADANVLLVGESGTGKELVATELVRHGPRATKPLVVVDCAALAPSLVESELFGHRRGAFTSADRDREGAFEAADGGTVLLDEIGELPANVQPKLLRVLESGTVRRLGDNHAIPVDVRVIAATNRDLVDEVKHQRFRSDLYFRISVMRVRLPPLREHLDDLPALLRHFLTRRDAGSRYRDLFPAPVLAQLRRHGWPGNVRELRNYVERCLALNRAPSVEEEPALDTHGDPPVSGEVETSIDQPFSVAKRRAIATFERRYLTALLAWSEGNVSAAARRAGMDRMYLHRLLRKHSLNPRSEES